MNRENTVCYPLFTSHGCTACWKCVEACPRHAIRKIKFLWHRHAMPTHRNCIGCDLCVRICPNGCFSSRRNTLNV